MASITKTKAMLVFALVAALVPRLAQAATMDEYITCSLVYGALFEAAKRTQHDGMIQYTRPRLQVVLPYMQENRENPIAKRRLSQISTALENEIRFEFVQEVSAAITGQDLVKLRAATTRVFQCDKAFGLQTLPFPLQGRAGPAPNKYLEGFLEGCLAKQRAAQQPLPNALIQKYCSCMTAGASDRGVDARITEVQLGQIIRDVHGPCLSSLR